MGINRAISSPLILLIALLACSTSAIAVQDVGVGIYALNLGKFDVATGGYTADFYLSLKCDSNCSPGNFEFANGRATSTDLIIDKPTEKFYRIQANLASPVDLRRFPFDRQKMQIVLEDKKNTIEHIKYYPLIEESGIDDSVLFTGWNLDGWNATVNEHHYAPYDETYSRYTFSVDISRIFINSFMKTILPVIFMLIVVVSTFLIDPDKITTRLTTAGSSLVAAVMFHISISNQIPPLGYLTFADKFMLLTYLVLLASFIISIALLELSESGKKELAEKIHRRTEWAVFIVVPLMYIALFLFFL